MNVRVFRAMSQDFSNKKVRMLFLHVYMVIDEGPEMRQRMSRDRQNHFVLRQNYNLNHAVT